MRDGNALNKNDPVVALFGVFDPEGTYVSGCAIYSDERSPGDIAKNLAEVCLKPFI